MRWRTFCHYSSRVESRRLRQVDTCVGLDLRRRSEITEIATARNSGPFVFSLQVGRKASRTERASAQLSGSAQLTWNNPETLSWNCKEAKPSQLPNSGVYIQKAFRVQNIFTCRSKQRREHLEGNHTAAAPSSNHTAVKQTNYWLNNHNWPSEEEARTPLTQWGNVPTLHSENTLLQLNNLLLKPKSQKYIS